MSSTQTDESWIEAFIFALRLRRVRGDAIGDAVAVVREHIADSGQGADEAFGTADDYAKQLDLPTVPTGRWTDPPVLGTAVSLVGLIAFAPAISTLLRNASMEMSLPQLFLFAIPGALLLTLPYYFTYGLRHPWILSTGAVLAILAGTSAGLLAPERGFQAIAAWEPWWLALGSGAAILAASGWAAVNAWRTGPEPIIDPTTRPPAPVGRVQRLIRLIPHLLIPLMALAVLVSEL